MLDSSDPDEDDEDMSAVIVRSVKGLNMLAKILRYYTKHTVLSNHAIDLSA